MFHETHNLAGYLEGALEPQAAARVERHLEACAHCRSALADMRAAKRFLNAAGESVRPVQYNSEVWTRVHAQIATPHRQAPLRPRWALAGGGLALGAAAICLALMMNLPHRDHSDSGPTLTVVPPPKSKPVLTAKVPSISHETPKKWGSGLAPYEAPRAEQPPKVPRTPGNESITSGNPPIPTAAPSTMSPSVTKDQKTMMAKAEPDATSVPFGASGNSQQNTYFKGRPEDKPAPRGTFAMRNTVNGDAQNMPLVKTQASPHVTDLADNDMSLSAHRGVELPGSAATGGRRPDSLDIVSADAPPVPSTLGISGQVTERALMPKNKVSAPVGSERSRPTMDGGITRSGMSTVEAHRLYSEADSAFRAGKDSVANLYYSDAIRHGLDSYESRVSEVRLGDLAMKANDSSTAVKWYRAALSRSKDAEVLSKLGDALEKNGDAKGAADSYRQALSISPALNTAKEGLARVKGN